MAEGLDVIVVDDDPAVSELLSEMIKGFYTWGEVLAFVSAEEAVAHCLSRDIGVAIFVLDVFLGEETGFSFLDAITDKFPMAYQDSVIITGNASDDIVNMCLASDVTFLLEKPIRSYALQFAVLAIVSKYVKFAKKLMHDPHFAERIATF
jgi:response regulator of citrate/malate metabolism